MYRRLSPLLLAGFLASVAPVSAFADKPAQIDKNGLLVLLRSTFAAVQQANETGNYTVLRDLSAPAFQKANTSARLAEIFAGLRNRNFDLSGVQVLEPQLTVLPTIENNGMMRVAGFFPSAPMQVNFEVLYAPVDGRWRPFGISVGVGSSNPAPAAPAVAQRQAPAPVQAQRPERKKPVAKPVPHAKDESRQRPPVVPVKVSARDEAVKVAPRQDTWVPVPPRSPSTQARPDNRTSTGLY